MNQEPEMGPETKRDGGKGEMGRDSAKKKKKKNEMRRQSDKMRREKKQEQEMCGVELNVKGTFLSSEM